MALREHSRSLKLKTKERLMKRKRSRVNSKLIEEARAQSNSRRRY